jgi:carbamoyltransferase
MRQIVKVKQDVFELDLRFFRHHRENVPYSWDNESPEVGTLYSQALEELLGPARKTDEPLDQRHRTSRAARRRCTKRRSSAVGYGACEVWMRRPNPERRLCHEFRGERQGPLWSRFNNATSRARRVMPVARSARPWWWRKTDGASLRDTTANTPIGDRVRQDPLLEWNRAHQSASFSVTRFDSGLLCRETAQAISEGQVIGWFQGRLEWDHAR